MQSIADVPVADSLDFRAVGMSENPGGSSNVVGIICPPVEIELTDLSKSGGVIAPPAPPAPTTGLDFVESLTLTKSHSKF